MPAEGDPQPSSKGGIDPNFQTQVLRQRYINDQIWQNFNKPALWPWNMPENYSGDVIDNQAPSEAFKRDKANQDYVDAIKDANSSGVQGDLQRSAVQVDFLAQLERAFRARHLMPRTRAWALAMGRIKAHGNQKGAVVQLALEFVRELDKRSKS